MLNRGGRTDYFPRAGYEAVGELQTLKTMYPNIVIKKILLTYPFAIFELTNVNQHRLVCHC